MIEVSEQQIPIETNNKPSWFERIKSRFQHKPQKPQEVEIHHQVPSDSIISQLPETSPIADQDNSSREERRKAKKAKYEEWKKSLLSETDKSAAEIKSTIDEDETLPVKIETPTNSPLGIKERIPFNQGLSVDRTEIPWLETSEVNVPLELMTLATTKGEQFLYGSLIQGKKLKEALKQIVDANQLRSADDALLVQLSEFAQTRSFKDCQKVHNRRTKKEILETGNQDGQRVYFIRFDNIQNIPVIIRIAAGNKTKMKEIFSVITNQTRRDTRRMGKL